MYKKLLTGSFTIAVLAGTIGLSGCNTMQGVGQDVVVTGTTITKAATPGYRKVRKQRIVHDEFVREKNVPVEVAHKAKKAGSMNQGMNSSSNAKTNQSSQSMSNSNAGQAPAPQPQPQPQSQAQPQVQQPSQVVQPSSNPSPQATPATPANPGT